MNHRSAVKFRPLLAAGALLMLFSASVVLGQDATPAATPAATAAATSEANSDAIPPEVSNQSNSWALPNGDYANTRNATSTINAGNVSQLGVAWSVTTPAVASFGAFATNPVVVDGVVYYEDLTSHIFAVKLDDGSLVWDKDYKANNIGPNGLAVGYGKLYATVGTGAIAALNLSNGQEVWNQKIDVGPTEGIDIQPTVYDNLIYISTVPGVDIGNFYKGGGSGTLHALNAITGQVVWSFDTVDSKDIWGNPEVNSGGGAWYPPAIDTATGTTYWTAANPAPWPGTADFPNGSSRPGPNLYSDSLVALDHQTGSMRWYNQVKSHDLFDLDLQLSPILATATIAGQQHDIVIASGKLGTVFAMDRKSGETLWQTNVGEHQNDYVQEIPPGKTIKVLPGSLGGVETPMALSTDGILYVPLLNQPNYYTATGQGESTEQPQSTGQILAIDINTGAILWNHNFASPVYGAATVVNDLVFTSTYDGNVYAFNRATGEQVWNWLAPGGINGFPAAVGDTIIIPVGVGAVPQMVALRLGAAGQVATPEATAGAAVGATAEATANAGDTSAQANQTAIPSAATAEVTSSPITQGNPQPTEAAGAATAEATAAAGTGGASSATGDLAQYLTVDAASKTVTIQIQAGLGSANGGLNFNGRAHGDATVTVPEGYTVTVEFQNVGMLPHSAMVVTPDQIKQPTITTTAFPNAETPNPNAGTPPGATVSFKFTADKQGQFDIVCGVPGHGLAGQYIHFIIGASDVQPSFSTNAADAGSTTSSGV